MSCDCSKARPLPSCVTSLTIGVGEVDTDYIVVLKTSDGRLDTYRVTSDSTGIISVTGLKVRTNTTYELWVSVDDYPYAPANINVKETITIGDTEVDCLFIEFLQAYESDDIETFTTQTISLA